MKRIIALVLIACSAILTGCGTLEPWNDKDHLRMANRYCGGMQNYDKHWGQCKGPMGSMAMTPGVATYRVQPGDFDGAGMGHKNGLVWERE